MVKKIILFFIFVLVALGTFLGGYLVSRQPGSASSQPALINNSLIMKKTVMLAFACLLPLITLSQGLTNNGAVISIGSGKYVTLSGTSGDLVNQNSGNIAVTDPAYPHHLGNETCPQTPHTNSGTLFLC